MLLYNFLNIFTYLWLFTSTLGINQGRYNYSSATDECTEIIYRSEIRRPSSMEIEAKLRLEP